MSPKIDISRGIENVIKRNEANIVPKLQEIFKSTTINYPPNEISLLAFKNEQKIELWARDENKTWLYIHTYPLTAFSGEPGPKLRENDKQIPEGIYRFKALNPYSSMHLSIMLDYPNLFDKAKARKDGRYKLGGDIFLHGKETSVGCLAVGNNAIEELFFLVHLVGLSNVKVIIAPNDLRNDKPITTTKNQPKWLGELYSRITIALQDFKNNNTWNQA